MKVKNKKVKTVDKMHTNQPNGNQSVHNDMCITAQRYKANCISELFGFSFA